MNPALQAAAGLAVGFAAGFAVRRARLCSFAAIECAVTSGDTRALRAYAMALALAIAVTQPLLALGWLQADSIALLPQALPWAGALVGGAVFGLGMSMVGTCAFGCVVRLGSGDLRSLVVLIVFSTVAWATMRGVLLPLRTDLLDHLAIPLADAPAWLRPGVAAVTALGLAAWALRSRALRRSHRLIWAAVALGGGVAAGWLVTGVWADDFEPVRPHSLSFVGPVAALVHGLMLQPLPPLDFGVGAVIGVGAGACAAGWWAGDLRWEAFDDHHEMRRQLAGAALMGVGGILASGCTIGQGLSAGSLLAPSWPFAALGLVAGARLGIAILIGGGVREWLQLSNR